MQIFLTGANGYVSGAAAVALLARAIGFAVSFATGPRPAQSQVMAWSP